MTFPHSTSKHCKRPQFELPAGPAAGRSRAFLRIRNAIHHGTLLPHSFLYGPRLNVLDSVVCTILLPELLAPSASSYYLNKHGRHILLTESTTLHRTRLPPEQNLRHHLPPRQHIGRHIRSPRERKTPLLHQSHASEIRHQHQHHSSSARKWLARRNSRGLSRLRSPFDSIWCLAR